MGMTMPRFPQVVCFGQANQTETMFEYVIGECATAGVTCDFILFAFSERNSDLYGK
jgi:hypothetical protein